LGPAPALDHVQVAAPPGCEVQARRFYGRLLGLRELEKPASLRGRGGVWFALRGAQLHVGVVEPFVAAAKAHPALRVADEPTLEQLAQRLMNAGGVVEWDDEIAGIRRFFTADPWGNRLELLATRRRADS
jgi:catechol 2,3-dioxygenase-like lactoylglutathione lyase family enzyme